MIDCVLAAALAAAPATQPAGSTLAALLARAADYVAQFEKDFSSIISDEDYDQKVSGKWYGRKESRNTRSEMLFLHLPEDNTWLTVRNVRSIDHRPIRDSAKRLDEALNDPNIGDRLTRLRRLRDEGSRFNLGVLRRNINFPTMVLSFLEAAVQPRFAFREAAREPVNGIDAHRIEYEERQQPTLVQDEEGRPLVARGTIWLGDAGAVLKTTLAMEIPASWTSIAVAVDFRRDKKAAMWAPVRMEETYTQRFMNAIQEKVECTATYSNFRRFETSVRIVP